MYSSMYRTFSGSVTPQWQSKDFSTPATPTEPEVAFPKPSTVLPAAPLVSASAAHVTMGTYATTTANAVTNNSLPSINAHQQQNDGITSSIGNSKQTSQLLHTTVYTR